MKSNVYMVCIYNIYKVSQEIDSSEFDFKPFYTLVIKLLSMRTF